MYGPVYSAPTALRKSNPGIMGLLAVGTVQVGIAKVGMVQIGTVQQCPGSLKRFTNI